MTKTVLVVDLEAERYVDRLSSQFPQLTILGAISFEEAEPRFAGTEILVTKGSAVDGVEFTRAHAARMPRLEWIQCLISGCEHIVHALDGREHVLITTVSGIHGPQVSEMAVLHMLALSRNARRLLRNHDAHVWDRLEQRVLTGKMVGIVGLGAIGAYLARVCKAFGMTVYGLSRSARSLDAVDRTFNRTELVDLARDVDFLVVVVPETAETVGLIDAQVLSAMKPTAYLINLARGPVVDEEALIAALRAGEIAGAGLDVFAVEPLPATSPLWNLENVIITPHVAGRSDHYVEGALTVVEHNLAAYLRGARDDLVNVIWKP